MTEGEQTFSTQKVTRSNARTVFKQNLPSILSQLPEKDGVNINVNLISDMVHLTPAALQGLLIKGGWAREEKHTNGDKEDVYLVRTIPPPDPNVSAPNKPKRKPRARHLKRYPTEGKYIESSSLRHMGSDPDESNRWGEDDDF